MEDCDFGIKYVKRKGNKKEKLHNGTFIELPTLNSVKSPIISSYR